MLNMSTVTVEKPFIILLKGCADDEMIPSGRPIIQCLDGWASVVMGKCCDRWLSNQLATGIPYCVAISAELQCLASFMRQPFPKNIFHL